MASDPRQRMRLNAAASNDANTNNDSNGNISLFANSNQQQQQEQQLQDVPLPDAAQSSIKQEPQQASSLFLRTQDAEEDEEDMEVDEAPPLSMGGVGGNFGSSYNTTGSTPTASATIDPSVILSPDSYKLLSPILPSPFPQHHAGPTAARFRNALNRVATHPQTDVEAWLALITEVQACYKSILDRHTPQAAVQLDWVESCYGTLLENFPFAGEHYVMILSILFAQSARAGEPEGPPPLPPQAYGSNNNMVSARAQLCEYKIHAILPRLLGVDWQGQPLQDDVCYGMLSSKVELWLLYIRKVARDSQRNNNSDARALTVQAYQTASTYAGYGYNNHIFWRDYLSFVQGWMPPEMPGQQLTAEQAALRQDQRSHLRQCYQSLVVHPMTGLDQLWNEYEAWEKAQSEALGQALVAEYQPLYQHARTVYLERQRVYTYPQLQLERLATLPAPGDDEDDEARREEYECLKCWKTRCAYERTNPERLQAAALTVRIRTIFREMVSVWTRHIEVWYMWSMWELMSSSYKRVDLAQQVLQAGLLYIPDATLLAHAQVQMVEQHTDKPQQALTIWQDYLKSSTPNTLAFILYQQCVRRYQDKEAARAVFAKARRVLQAGSSSTIDGSAVGDSNSANIKGKTGTVAGAGDGADGTSEQNGTANNQPTGHDKVITHRLDHSTGTKVESDYADVKADPDAKESQARNKPTGSLTWHLYASHATMEHRLNNEPNIAARVYELGLRKHATFLTKPPYVMRYAQLLLELSDTVNLRALLTRAVAACQQSLTGNEASLAAMWDMTLHFESILSGADHDSVIALQKIEQQRRAAILGPEVEDVASGGFVGIGDVALISAQKITVAEQIMRTEGYNTSSAIVNGTSRMVDVLEIMGMWGSGESDVEKSKKRIKPATSQEVEISGTKTDAELQKRLQFHTLYAMGASTDSSDVNIAGSKLLSARERLQAGATGGGAVTAIQLAIQQMPEWLRTTLQLLPASRLRLPVVAKPPPHLTELALSTIRANALPAERPPDEKQNGNQKRKSANGESSDEEDDFGRVGGYGSQFRTRQRARLQGSAINGGLEN